MKSGKEEPQHIGSLLEDVLSEKGYLTFCREYGILQKWELIVDKKFAAVSKCERIENGIVYVKVTSSAWRQEAVYCKENILNRIQKDYGCTTIKDIIFY